jgi:sugar/nucleoside kinase (ribokinase family)
MHTIFFNNYENGLRTQKVVSYPENLSLREFHYPHIWEPPKLIFYCPVLSEIDCDFLDIFENSIKVCNLQGWMRALDKDGNVSIRKDLPEIKFSKFDVVILSEFDVTIDQALEISNFSLVCLTQGEKGSSLIKNGNVKNFDTLSVNCIDSTGAGDVWAITFSIFHYILNKQINDSAKFANLAATFSVEGLGDSRIPSMEKLLNNRTW